MSTDDDGDTSAKLSVSLGGIKGVAVEAAELGPHTWTGLLCDNTPATIAYDVAVDGTVSNVVATPLRRRQDRRRQDRRAFSHDERVRIKVREHDGQIKISVDERIRCRFAGPDDQRVDLDPR